MEFRDLALETIYLITGFLELDSDISALSRTSRQLHLSLDPYLYTNNVKRNHGCALVWAARLGRLSVARKLLEAGVPLVHEQAQPICLATIYGHDAIVKLFLERGLRPNKKELWWLQKWDCCDKIAEYYDSYTKGYYFDPIFAEEENKDPIDIAIDCGHDSLLQLLHAYDGMALWDQAKVADAIRRSIWHSYLAVVRFSEEKYPGTMKYLVQHDKSLLCTARNTEIAQALMEAGAPVNITSADGNTPLSNAVRFNKADLVCFLVEAGACSNPVRPDGVILNLLRWAALEQNLEIVQHLMTHVDVESTIRAGGEDLAELLLVAVACGFEDLSERILMTKCIPGKTRDDCQILFSESDLLLKLAAKSGNINIVTLLLEKGADLNNEPRLGQTPLTVACESGNTDLVVLLLKHGIDVNHRDHEGKPALF
ncbi:hypothetical protein PENCOP_c002G08967 [Penicillium coprophilum]|uniref:Uncharacterized protein n=1 Tax=Penicillium coprophilum TaxID=36646 RepID=A0A1V6V391_9EURO|nr:hypothetical protein PENCOP_c002G08967 [Penicillium coprophilum]